MTNLTWNQTDIAWAPVTFDWNGNELLASPSPVDTFSLRPTYKPTVAIVVTYRATVSKTGSAPTFSIYPTYVPEYAATGTP